MKKVILIGLSGLMVGTLYANPPKCGKSDMKEQFPMRNDCLSELNLTTSQMSEIEQLKSEFRTNMMYNFENLKANSPLKVAISSGEFDKDKFIEIERANFDKMIELKADYSANLYNVLTNEQKVILKTNLENNISCGLLDGGHRR